MNGARMPAAGRTVVRIGEVAVRQGNGVLYTIGLGSCIAVALYDAAAHVAGLAHVMLPQPADARAGALPDRFATLAVPRLLGEMAEWGADPVRVRARIAGGASMFAGVLTDGGRSLGARNAMAVRNALAAAGVPLEAEDLGGTHGRSVYLDAATGVVTVASVGQCDRAL